MYKSQCGQDAYLNEHIFKGMRSGRFIDVGAHDGISLSNTWFFEKELGWSGICVEPNPNVFKKLVRERSCTCVNVCISNENTVLDFTVVEGYAEMLSGITTNYDSRHLERIRREVKERGGAINNVQVPSRTLESLIDESGVSEYDFCSIDVEGSEIDVVKSINFDKVKIKYFTIENNYRLEDINKYLSSKGYDCIHRLEADDVYRLRGI